MEKNGHEFLESLNQNSQSCFPFKILNSLNPYRLDRKAKVTFSNTFHRK